VREDQAKSLESGEHTENLTGQERRKKGKAGPLTKRENEKWSFGSGESFRGEEGVLGSAIKGGLWGEKREGDYAKKARRDEVWGKPL